MQFVLTMPSSIFFLSNSLIAQLTPTDTLYGRSIPGDSILTIVDSMIVTKYQVYISEFNRFSGYPNRPTSMRAYIKGFDFVDSVSLKHISDKIEVQLSNSSYLATDWVFAVLKPGNKSKIIYFPCY